MIMIRHLTGQVSGHTHSRFQQQSATSITQAESDNSDSSENNKTVKILKSWRKIFQKITEAQDSLSGYFIKVSRYF